MGASPSDDFGIDPGRIAAAGGSAGGHLACTDHRQI